MVTGLETGWILDSSRRMFFTRSQSFFMSDSGRWEQVINCSIHLSASDSTVMSGEVGALWDGGGGSEPRLRLVTESGTVRNHGYLLLVTHEPRLAFTNDLVLHNKSPLSLRPVLLAQICEHVALAASCCSYFTVCGFEGSSWSWRWTCGLAQAAHWCPSCWILIYLSFFSPCGKQKFDNYHHR